MDIEQGPTRTGYISLPHTQDLVPWAKVTELKELAVQLTKNQLISQARALTFMKYDNTHISDHDHKGQKA